MAMPELFSRPLKGMGTWLGRLVLNVARALAFGAVALVVVVVLDTLLLPDRTQAPHDRLP